MPYRNTLESRCADGFPAPTSPQRQHSSGDRLLPLPGFPFPQSQGDGGARMAAGIDLDRKWLICLLSALGSVFL